MSLVKKQTISIFLFRTIYLHLRSDYIQVDADFI